MERYSHLQALPNSPLTPLTPLCENTAFDFNFGGDGSLDLYIDNIRQKHMVEQHQTKTPVEAANKYLLVPKRYSEKFLRLRDVFEPSSQGKYIKKEEFEQFEVSPCRLNLTDPPKKHSCQADTTKENLVPVINHIVHHKDCEILKKSQEQNGNQKQQQLEQNQEQQAQSFVTPRAPIKMVVHTVAASNNLINDYVATPKNGHSHLKQRNSFLSVNQTQKQSRRMQQMHKQKQQQYRDFLQSHLGSPNKCKDIIHTQPFRKASPVELRPLCPSIAKILQRCGLTMYCGLFQREEIDMLTLQLLQRHDLQQIGVTDSKHCDILMSEIRYSRQYF